jgi:hypothetical protein
MVEQDHRAVKRVRVSGPFTGGTQQFRVYRNDEQIRKGQVRWLPKRDVARQAAFVGRLFELTTP